MRVPELPEQALVGVGWQPQRGAPFGHRFLPRPVAALSVLHGSIAVDGCSMTVNAIPRPGVVQLAVIPHTLEVTTLVQQMGIDEKRAGMREAARAAELDKAQPVSLPPHTPTVPLAPAPR